EIREVNDFRFAGGAFNDSHAVCKSCGHHDITSAKNGRSGAAPEKGCGADELPGSGFNVAAFNADFCAESFKTFQMEIDGARADDASAGERDGGFFEAAEQRTHDANRTAHFPDEFIVAGAFDFFGVNLDGVAFDFDG